MRIGVDNAKELIVEIGPIKCGKENETTTTKHRFPIMAVGRLLRFQYTSFSVTHKAVLHGVFWSRCNFHFVFQDRNRYCP